MKSRKRKKIMPIILLLIIALLLVFRIDYRLQVSQYTFMDIRLPDAFNGYTVVHISDLHNARFGANQQKLVDAVAAQSPDLIVLTGDIMDRKSTSLDNVKNLLQGIAPLAPIYSVSGNHEEDNPILYKALKQLYAEYGVTVLDGEMVQLRKGNDSIYLGGLAYDAVHEYGFAAGSSIPTPPKGGYGLLLYHDTTQYELLTAYGLGYQYLFAGHTHGGIIRIPFVGGLIDNDLNWFPQYDSGVFGDLPLTLISSRGLGDSSGVPLPRINNRPELVSVTFYNT